MHDTFISYAVEDNDFASSIAYRLRDNGLSVWYAPLSLTVGDKLLNSIERGMMEARTGILVLSRQYIAKNWTNFEMDTLIRHHIEQRKKLLPIWLDVSKEELDQVHSGLSGIVAITETTSLDVVISQLIAALSDGARVRGVVPGWESPVHRFLSGLGEINLQSIEGPATTIFEFLIHMKETDYPLWLAGKTYSKEELLLKVAEILGPDPSRVENWVGKDGYERLWSMCVACGIDPKIFY